MPVNYDKIAPVYDLLSRIVFGSQIIKAQMVLLKFIPVNCKMLIVGGGTGWILEKIAELHPSGMKIDYVESSGKMIALAQKRNCRDNTVNFIHLPIENYSSSGYYDVTLTPFLFDNFKRDKAEQIFNQLHLQLNNKGTWLYADFILRGNRNPLWQKLLLKVMYFFFRVTCNIETSTLVRMDEFYDSNGYQKLLEQELYWGFIKADVYQKI